ncbi:MAG: ATP synthase F1 subunit gamma [Candidatus Saccharicenans sp.]|uniref:ATP synthase F1 subunit gamma n=1 Tax=Candidatus Saccharicenans sp. TaxID=2819258 RepID=UPI00404B8929
MPTLIDLRRRIQSIRNSQQVTQAMKTVATARFKKAHRLVVERRPFWHVFPDLALALSQTSALVRHPFLETRPEKKIEVIVITSDKGLCGAFNSNLLTTAGAFLEQKQSAAAVAVIPVGRKASAHFRRLKYPVVKSYAEGVDKRYEEISQELKQHLEYRFVFQQVDAVYVVYNEFRSILAPRITITRLLPLKGEAASLQPDYLQPDWEPEASRIIDYLLRFYLKYQLQHYLLESQAAEQASRMMAMENATKNAEELISDLVLLLNKIRQASITRELLEIQTAVEALKQQGV